MLLDYHIHTDLCRHAQGAPDNYVKTAIKRGLGEIGFSDHCPWPAGFDMKSRMAISDFPQYKKILSGLREKFPSLPIKYGLEVDWVPGRMDEVWDSLDKEEFDYLIGSIHHVGDFPFDNPERLKDIKRWTIILEKKYSKVNKRTINIDPGYLTLWNFVLSAM